jgi:hypothetical protein
MWGEVCITMCLMIGPSSGIREAYQSQHERNNLLSKIPTLAKCTSSTSVIAALSTDRVS